MNEITTKKSKGFVLIVDDVPADLNLLSSILEESGYSVHPTPGGEIALEFIKTTIPDLILLDVHMPDMDGFEVCHKLKINDITRDIPVIFFSAMEVEINKVKAFDAGAVDFIQKPFQKKELLARIKTHLSLRNLQINLEVLVEERTHELQITNNQLSKAQAIAHLGIWDWDIQTGDLTWSDEIYLIFGLQPQEFGATYQAFLEHVHPEDREFVQTSVDEAVNQKIKYNIEHRVLRPDGEVRIVNEIGEVTYDIEEKPIRMIGIVHDITESKQQQKRVETLTERLELATSVAKIGIWDWDLKTNTLIWDDAMYELFGISRDDTAETFEAWTNGVHPDDLSLTDANIQAALIEGQGYVSEFRVLWPDGTIRHTQSTAAIYRDGNGNPERMIGIDWDITDRIEAKLVIQSHGDNLAALVEERTAELQESENRYRIVVEDQTEFISRWKPDGTLIFVNNRFAELLDQQQEDLIGKNLFKFVSSMLKKRILKKISNLTPEQPIYTDENMGDRGKGENRWFFWTERGFFDPEGNLIEIQSVGRDVTKQKKAEEALLISEEKYRAIVQDQTEFLVRYLPDTTITFANENYSHHRGMSTDELVGTKLLDAIPKSHVSRIKDMIKSLTPKEPVTIKEYLKIRPNGKEIWESWTDRGIFDENGDLVEIQGVGRDITSSKHDERELASLYEQTQLSLNYTEALYQSIRALIDSDSLNYTLQTLVDNVAEALTAHKVILFTLRSDGVEIEHMVSGGPGVTNDESFSVNEIQASLSGWVSNIISPIEPQNFDEKPQAYKTRKKQHNGSTIVVPMLYKNRILGMLTVINHIDDPNFSESDFDLTKALANQAVAAIENVRLFEAAENASQAKSEFLANMSHEIRTPMNAIIGMSHLILQTELNVRQQDYLSKIQSSAHNLLGIVNDILDFSKIEAGRLDIESIPFDLEDVLNDLANLLNMRSEDKDLEIIYAIPPDFPTRLVGDPMRLEQILLNLGSNAVKFTDTGEVVISAEVVQRKEDQITLLFTVRDTGIGIEKKQISQLFQAFSQADSSTTRNYGGSGLGLSISKQLIELMGGEIWVDSQPGEGSTFSFSVICTLSTKDERPRSVSIKDINHLNILAIDDNPTALETLKRYLEAFNLQVSLATTGEEGLKLIKEVPSSELFDLILLDWKLPGIGGIELAKLIKADPEICQVPIIIMVTEFGREEISSEFQEIGLDGLLAKPFSQSILYDVIMTTLNKETSIIATPKPPFSIKDSSALQGTKMLVVEDNEINQEVAQGLLEAIGVNVVLASNGKEAISELQKTHFDIILMDIQMPEMDGLEATRKIRKSKTKYRDTIIIAMTAQAMKEDYEKSIQAGMNDHITKPINLSVFYDTLSKWIKPVDQKTIGATPIFNPNNKFQDLQGIDTHAGLQRLGNKPEHYQKLLKMFRSNHSGIVCKIETAIKSRDFETAAQLAHTLRGAAGNIGADQVLSDAHGLETALKTGDESQLNDHISALKESFAIILSSIKTLKEHASEQTMIEAPDEPKAIDPKEMAPLFNKLAHCLQENDTQALIIINDLRNTISTPVLQSSLKQLERLINLYTFEEALQNLILIAKEIGVDLHSDENDKISN